MLVLFHKTPTVAAASASSVHPQVGGLAEWNINVSNTCPPQRFPLKCFVLITLLVKWWQSNGRSRERKEEGNSPTTTRHQQQPTTTTTCTRNINSANSYYSWQVHKYRLILIKPKVNLTVVSRVKEHKQSIRKFSRGFSYRLEIGILLLI